MNTKEKKLLKTIGDAEASGNFHYAKPATAKSLADAGLVEGNNDMKADNGTIPFRLTDNGKTEYANMADANENTNENNEPAFVIKSVELPKIARGGGGGMRGSKYPVDALEVGQSFFIPAPEDMKSPSKSYGSMVSAANKRYGGERKFTTRTTTGDDWDQPGVRGVAVFRVA